VVQRKKFFRPNAKLIRGGAFLFTPQRMGGVQAMAFASVIDDLSETTIVIRKG